MSIPKVIGELKEGGPIRRWLDSSGNEIVEVIADMDIDCDGSGGNPHGDPYFQPDTSYHHEGRALNAERVPFVVAPPLVRASTIGRVLGCFCQVENVVNGMKAVAIVGDFGPSKKDGEGSCELARRLGLSGNPNTGGTDKPIIRYRIFPGRPATIDGVTYSC